MDSPEHAEAWYAQQELWREEVLALRSLVLATQLMETLKWRQPCYTDRGKNIVIISWMKAGAVASFLKGALLDDPDGRLLQPGQDRSARYRLFASVEAVQAESEQLLRWIDQAVSLERAGARIPPLPDAIDYVDELRERLAADEAFRAAFEGLTLGRRRGYNLHFAQAKKSATRVARIERYTERILAGKGLRDCVCGHSKRYPQCDGSHKHRTG